MSELVLVRKKGQVTLPSSIRRELGVEEGDILDIRVVNGSILLRAKKLIDKEQSWFWTQRWQEGEREAEEDIRAGRVRRFKDADEAVTALHAKAASPPGRRPRTR